MPKLNTNGEGNIEPWGAYNVPSAHYSQGPWTLGTLSPGNIEPWEH